MNNDPIITTALQTLEQFYPDSIFLYGSRGRGDFNPNSDYELGVVFPDDGYVQQEDIRAVLTDPNVKAYCFKRDELLRGTFHWLFQKSLFVREIIQGGKTIAGEELLPEIRLLPITTLDLMQDIRFSTARALDALLSFRSGDLQTSMELFSKSCFYGLRDLEILELKTFPLGYDQIYERSARVVVELEYRKAIEVAYAFRKEKQVTSIDMLYENISLLDSLIEPKIVAAFQARGNEKLV